MKISLIKLIQFSSLQKIILPGKDGKQRWVELSEKFLPPGGKKFNITYVNFYIFFIFKNFFQGTFGFVIGLTGFITYVLLQNEYNSDTIYNRMLFKNVFFLI